MKFIDTKITGLKIIKPLKNDDFRGCFMESFRQDLFEKYVNNNSFFCQENIVKSQKMVLRGLHYQIDPFSQSKLITVLSGEILDIAVDLRKSSKTFGNHFKIRLSSDDKKSLFIPKGFAHGYLTLSDDTLVCYKVDNYYNRDSQRGIYFQDPSLNIDWEYDISDFIISERDKKLPYL